MRTPPRRAPSKPTKASEDDDTDAYCCQNDGNSCDDCSWIAPPGNYCAQSESNCGGDWDSLSESGEFLRAYVRDATLLSQTPLEP